MCLTQVLSLLNHEVKVLTEIETNKTDSGDAGELQYRRNVIKLSVFVKAEIIFK